MAARFCFWLALLFVVPFAAGCEDKPDASANPSTPSTPAPSTAEVLTEEQAEIEKALAQLDPADRALAEKQKICPVAEEPLGSMGKPEIVEVSGQKVFICCEGCRKPLLAKPEKYLANLDAVEK
jgi:hypothetical protein